MHSHALLCVVDMSSGDHDARYVFFRVRNGFGTSVRVSLRKSVLLLYLLRQLVASGDTVTPRVGLW